MLQSPAKSDWLESESRHFRIVYREGHAHLVPHILGVAELSLERLSELFGYEPSQTIVINTYDVNDYGAGFATTVPRNYIWLDLSPLEPGYENIPYNERLQWLLSHELVHIVVNDLATSAEAFNRSIFSKVPPEQAQPLSIFYSLITNFGRYTPRWHQEGMAVFLETWLSGGFGRAMGSFDEMYFRCLVLERKKFPSPVQIESQLAAQSFLTETHHYLYGQRFVSHLILQHGFDKVVQWYRAAEGDFYVTFKSKFEEIFGNEFTEAWEEFVNAERLFQGRNLWALVSSPTTRVRRLSEEPLGAVTQPHVDLLQGAVFWGQHRPHRLAGITRLDLLTRHAENIGTLPTPSTHHVASTAYNPGTHTLFYTTNNNQLYRDIRTLDVETGKSDMIFPDCRVGNITIAPATQELWGVRHQGGGVALVLSQTPYDSLREVLYFAIGDEIHGLSASPSGKLLAIVLHRANGEQSIVLYDCDKIKRGEAAAIAMVTDRGSPEHPSWSPDERFLFWNAYTNGVSNIYRKDFESGAIEAVSHTLTGLFKPAFVTADSLFAFEFSTTGFYPVLIPNVPAKSLPAITYLGQRVAEAHPALATLASEREAPFVPDSTVSSREYSGLRHLNIVSILPVLTGFGSNKVVGLFTHISDPILDHDMILEVGVSPFGERFQRMRFHSRFKYEYKKEFELSWDFNGTDFYDLFNKRKRGMVGHKVLVGNTHYWVYDNPMKVKQRSELTLYSGVQSISDNLVPVSQPDFFVAQSGLTFQNLRRSIGSSDHEHGNEFALTAMLFGSSPKQPEFGYQVYAEWDHFTTYAALHNVLHTKLAAGYHRANARLTQSRFYFGGFGNRALENVEAKQFRKVFRFPGIPVFSYGTDRFVKLLVENNFPPVRFQHASLGQHFLSHIDVSLFAQTLVTNGRNWFGVDGGGQINLIFKHWFNLESTLSGGYARAWIMGRPSDEWFVSFKLLKN